jgi:OOP family OmpA-OmpF porin
MTTGKLLAGTVALAGLTLSTWGCATKKHVRESIAPVQNQVNDVQKETAANKQSIGDLDRQVATADEKATDAGKRAGQALDAAGKANDAATQAGQRADAANSAAMEAQNGVTKLDHSLQNLDNYKLVNTQQVFFKTARYALDKDSQAQLDAAIQPLGTMKSYVIEIEGYTDRTGGKAYNLELGRRRADAVVRYLTVEHNIPLRNIRELGVGSEFPNAENKTRDDRKQNRRVDIKVYALDLTGQQASNQADRQRNDQQQPDADSQRRPAKP